MADVVELVRQIGVQPGDPGFKLTAANKGLVQKWMIAQGLDPARVDVARERLIRKAYAEPHYLRHLKNRGDYNPAACRSTPMADRSPFTISAVQQPAPADPMKALAAALQTIVAPGVTEDRVVALIYDHVPGLIKLSLAEMFGEMAAKLSDEEN